MNCIKWEESIYLYDELTAEEQKSVTDHVQQCAACYQLLAEVRQTQNLVKSASIVKAQMRNPELLTRKVMQAIEPKPYHKPLISVVVEHLFTRYALAALSLVLIAFFISEQQKEFKQTPVVIVSATQKKVTLDSKSFLKAVKDLKSTKHSASITSFYSCAKTNQCGNTIVKYFKQKKQNENI